MVLGQRWDFFPPDIWCATDNQFDKQNVCEDSHWLIFAHGLVPAKIVLA